MDKITGKDITIKFDGKKCIHSRNCVLTLPDVFRGGVKGQWIFPDSASAEDIAHLARICPSGAIQYERNDGGQNEAKPKVNTARAMENGPVSMIADLKIDGEPVGNRAVLCRCGQSKNKPYCDGSHIKAGFEATGEIPIKAAEALENRNGPVEITPMEDGPLIVKGNLEILRGSGAQADQVTKTALCRCGHSKNKPYCDGTHAKIGFKTG